MMTDQLSLCFEQDMFVFYEEKNDTLIFSNNVNFITFLSMSKSKYILPAPAGNRTQVAGSRGKHPTTSP